MNPSTLAELLTSVVSPLGLEIDDFEIISAGKRRVLRVLVDGDGAEGRGPDLDQIAEANRIISQALDDAEIMGEAPYVLEVSSRGVSKPLTKPAHYRRNRGRLVALQLKDGSSLQGRILETDEKGIDLTLGEACQRIAFAEITKAVIQVELNRPVAENEE